jgi:hypothetical protein
VTTTSSIIVVSSERCAERVEPLSVRAQPSSDDVIDGVADGPQLGYVVVGNLDAELLFGGHGHFDH